MDFTILHISDIHKATGADYDSLLDSLKNDMENYEKLEVGKPSFIVVSGDLIQGAYSDEEIRAQYTDVEKFLNDLCGLMLDGKRERMIIVPGNHDMNRTVSKDCMEESSKDSESDLKEYYQDESIVRWSWKNLMFYRISDMQKYKTRFNLFTEFYNRFFAGIRSYPDEPEDTAYFECFDEYEVSFSCFNSCNMLDHLRDTGNISEDSINSVTASLIEAHKRDYLNIAVWHHHYYSHPMATNYMDRDILNVLLHYNVNIGLYGHQHYSQIADEHTDLLDGISDRKKMLLISAGTLFGGDKEIPSGCKRQYNLIKIHKEENHVEVYIHVREDKNISRKKKLPCWVTKTLENSTNSIHYSILLSPDNIDKKLRLIDRQVNMDKDYMAACESLKKLDMKNSRVRQIFMDYLKEVKDCKYRIDNALDLYKVEYAVLYLLSALELNDKEVYNTILADNIESLAKDRSVDTLLNQIKAKL